MIIIPEREQLIIPPPRHPRSPGVHLSSVVRCIATETGILKPEWAEELSLIDARTITDTIAVTKICMGLAWEEWYIPTQLPHVADHPGELTLDGIYMTHDGEELSFVHALRRHVLVVHEVKLTYKGYKVLGLDADTSPEDALRQQWMWLSQVMGYCKGLGTRFAVIHVLAVCGDYSWPMTPQPWRFTIEFTQEEVDARWSLIRDYRDDFLANGREGEIVT